MSWYISVAGPKEELRPYVEKQHSYPEASDQSQIEAAKVLILAELDKVPDGKLVTIEASGHHDDQAGVRQMSVNVRRLIAVPS